MTHRLYDEKEVGTLIQRATELHEEAIGASEDRLSLEEVERIAAELGLPSEHVRAAALELEERRAGGAFSIWGHPFVIDQSRVVEGTLTEAQWETVVRELRRFTGSTGRISDVGRAREWTRSIKDGSHTLERTLVTMRSQDGQTSIQVRKLYGGGAVVAYLLGFIASATAAGVFLDGSGLSDLASLAIASGTGVGALAAVRASLSVWTSRQKERLRTLTDVLHHTLSPPPPESMAGEPAAGQIDLPDVDEPVEIPAPVRQRIRG